MQAMVLQRWFKVGEVSNQHLCTVSNLFFRSFSHHVVYAVYVIQCDYYNSIPGTH